MFIYGLLLLTFALALLSLSQLFIAGGVLLRDSWSRFLLALSLGVFIYLYGTWVYLTIHAKFVFGICFLIVLLWSFFRKKKPARKPRTWKTSANLVLTALLILLS